MPRQNRRRADTPLTAPRGGGERREDFRGTTYAVRAVTGQAATKPYRCPGCDHEIRPGISHVVCWPAEDIAAEERRHWHTACWAARDHRRPSGRFSR